MNLAQHFFEVARPHAGRTALIDRDQQYKFGELAHAVEMMAAVLAPATDREAVGIFLPTSAGFVIAAYGALRAGFGVMPINLLVSPENVAYSIKHSGIDTLITSQMFADKFKPYPLEVIVMEELVERMQAGELPDMGVLQGRPQPGDDDLAVLLYTSGTTGTPKGVRLTNRNLGSNISDCLKLFNVQDNDMIIGILPLFHTFAFTATMGLAMASGAGYVAHPRFDPEQTLASIEQRKVTVLIAIPSMYRLLNRVQKAKGYDVSSLRLAVAGGEPLPPAVEREFNEAFGLELLEGYGLTEASPVLTFNPIGENKSGTAGKPLPSVKCKVVDDSANEVPPGTDGEMIAHGPNIMQGYHKNPEATAEVVRNGWLHTGDMARMDEDGYFTITGRKKEMLIVAGENVFPVEVEAAFHEHPAIEHCAVIGEMDELRGEQVKVVIVPRDKALVEGSHHHTAGLEKELRAFVKDKLAAYKQPRIYDFRADVPLGPTGKVLKRKL